MNPLIQDRSSKNWNCEVDGSNKYQRYNDKIKLKKVTNSARYLLVKLFFDLDVEKKINKEPNKGNKINDDNIGKSIIWVLKKLITQKNLKALQKHNDI